MRNPFKFFIALSFFIILFCPTCWAESCPGDIDCNGIVDGKDLATFSSDYGKIGCTNQNAGGIHVYDSSEPPQYLGIYAGSAPGAGDTGSVAIFNPALKLFFIIEVRASYTFYAQVKGEHYDIDSSANIVLWQRDRLIHLCDGRYVTGIGDPAFLTISGSYYPDCNYETAPPNFEGWRYNYREVQLSEIPFTLPVVMPLRYDY